MKVDLSLSSFDEYEELLEQQNNEKLKSKMRRRRKRAFRNTQNELRNK